MMKEGKRSKQKISVWYAPWRVSLSWDRRNGRSRVTRDALAQIVLVSNFKLVLQLIVSLD